MGQLVPDAKEILFYTPGFTVSKLEVANNNQVKATIKIARILASASTWMWFAPRPAFPRCALSGKRIPTVQEKEPNSDFASPQKIPLNVTVHGVVDNEDVDYFAVEAKKGHASASKSKE